MNEIGKGTVIINETARQTNLLDLNAAEETKDIVDVWPILSEQAAESLQSLVAEIHKT